MSKKLFLFLVFAFVLWSSLAFAKNLKPNLSSDPSVTDPEIWRTWGDLSFSNDTMLINGGWADDYSSQEGFIFAGLFLVPSPERDVKKISADVKLHYTGDLSPAEIGINITKITDQNNNIQIRLVLSNSDCGNNGILTAQVFNHNRSTNEIVQIANVEIASDLSLEDYHTLRVSTNKRYAKMKYGNSQVSIQVDFDDFGNVIESDAYVWEWTYDPDEIMEGEVRNVKVTY